MNRHVLETLQHTGRDISDWIRQSYKQRHPKELWLQTLTSGRSTKWLEYADLVSEQSKPGIWHIVGDSDNTM